MKFSLDRIFTAPVLVVINFLIIFACETVGGGRFFEDSGAIHGIAVLFIVLAASRIFTRYYLFDPELKILLRTSLVAMAFFAFSHAIEFASFEIFRGYSDAAFANVINVYAVSLLIMLYGAETAIVRYNKSGEWKLGAIGVAIVALLTLTALFLTRRLDVDLGPEGLTPYAYMALMLITWGLCLLRWNRIGKMYAWFGQFISTVMLSAFMIMLAAVPNIFYEVFEKIGIDQFQSIYLSHFTFYAAISVMYLAFDQVQHLGGLHKDLREQMQAEDGQ